MQSLSVQVQPFVAWLLRSTLQASMLIGLILLVQITLRSKLGPRWSHALWLVLLLRMVLPWAPQSRISMFSLIPELAPPGQTEYVPEQSAAQSIDSQAVNQDKTGASPAAKESAKDTLPTATPAHTAPQVESAHFAVANVLPLLWLAGAMVLGIYICANNFALLRIVRRERPLTDQKILDLLEDCKAEMGIRTILGVVATDKVKSPSLFGFIRPRLLLPAGMIGALSPEDLRYVFLHELAHLKRHDIWLGWLMSILQVLHWFNPLVWLAFYHMRADRELACDALVLSRTESSRAKDYGRTIVSLLERFSCSQPLPAVAGILETKAQLKRRIKMIAQFKRNSYRWSALAVILIIILGSVSLPDAKHTKASLISPAKSETVSSSNVQSVAVGPAKDVHKTEIVTQELRISHSQDGVFLSREGDKLVFCRRKDTTAILIVRDLHSGQETEVTTFVSLMSSRPVISPDGNNIVYTITQARGEDWISTLHMLSLDTHKKRSLDVEGFAMDWSRDARLILTRKGDVFSIVAVNGDTVGKKDLTLPDGAYPCRFSPDAKHVSVCHKKDLYLYQVENGDMIQITHRSNRDEQPLWSPDGKMLVFFSRRAFGPEQDLCAVPVANGKSHGDVRIIMPDMGEDVELWSLSESGRVLYERSLEDRRVLATTIDPQTGQPTGEPLKLAEGTEAVWSPDGKRIAYISKEMLHVMSADGSNDQEIMKVDFHPTSTYAWAPDNDTIYMPEVREDTLDIYAISLSTKQRRPVLLGGEGGHHVTCSPDGKRLAFSRPTSSAQKRQVFVVDVDGSNLHQVTSYEDGYVWYPAWSPDGRYIAFEYGLGSAIKTLSVVSVDDGTTREVFRGTILQDRFYRKSWSPDGSKIAWQSEDGIYVGRVSDGKYDTFKAGMAGASNPRWSPDGRKMLFGTWVNVEQLMIMDNFLAAEK
jgi:beta-lactamase regulating signal transducer with metallopeptidase domain/Tol biopolymer transport system component